MCTLTEGGSNRHFIIPAKAKPRWHVVDGTPDDAVVEVRVSPQARNKCPELPSTWRPAPSRSSTRARKHVLLTSLSVLAQQVGHLHENLYAFIFSDVAGIIRGLPGAAQKEAAASAPAAQLEYPDAEERSDGTTQINEIIGTITQDDIRQQVQMPLDEAQHPA